MHPRRVIRSAFKDRMVGATAADDRIRTSLMPLDALQGVLVDEGPVIFVFVRSEEIKPEDYPVDGHDGAVRRTVHVTIEGCIVGYDADDKADDLAEQIEALFEDFVVPEMENTEIRLVSTDIDATDAFESILGGCLLTYEVKYWSLFRAEDDDDWKPTQVYSIANGEHDDPPGYADPLLGVEVPTPSAAHQLGWQPGDKIVDDTDDVWP